MSEIASSTTADTARLKLPQQRYRSGRNVLIAGLADIFSGLFKVRLWRELAWEDFVKRYRRSYFGILWAAISFAIFAMAIVFLHTSLMGGTGNRTTTYIVLGFLVFQTLSSGIMDGSNIFVLSANWIKSSRLPLSLFVYKDITRNFIISVFNAVGAGALLAWSGYRFPMEAYWAIAGVVAIFVNSIWVYLLLGTIVARFRDLFHLIGAIMRMAFFISPVMWVAPEEGMRAAMALYNPLTHFIAIVREPLLTGNIPVLSWQIVGGISLTGWILGVLAFCLFRRRIVYWV